MVNLANVIKLSKFFSRKQEELQTVTSVAVVFNIANHLSLLAATLYSLVRGLHDPDVQVILVDIRDNLPEADRYVWIDAGRPQVLRDALKDRIGSIKDPNGEKARIALIEKNSIVLETEATDTPSISTTSLGKVMMELEATFPSLEEDSLPRRLAARLWGLSLAFEQPKVAVEDYESYTRVLEMAYVGYHGTKISLQDLNTAAIDRGEPNEERLLAFREEQQFFASLIGRKTRLELIGTTWAYYITAMGPDVYAFIRRIRLAKKPYIHTSMGCYGVVVYTDSPLDASVALWKETIVLQPEFHPKAAAM